LFIASSFANYETHFTVMNYGRQLTQIHFSEFITEFEQENPKVKWEEVHNKIKNMIRELFIGIRQVTPQMHSPKV
jgi:tubulin--tyrosine ligase-like protein 12